MRTLTGIQLKLVMALAASSSLFHLYTAATGVLEARLQRGFHLLALIPLAYLLYPMTKRSPRDRIPWYDWVLAALTALPSLYVILDNDTLVRRWEGVTAVTGLQMLLGVIVTAVFGRSSTRTSPVTYSCVLSTKASIASRAGENQSPS